MCSFKYPAFLYSFHKTVAEAPKNNTEINMVYVKFLL